MKGRRRDTILFKLVEEGASADPQFVGSLLFVPTTLSQYVNELIFFSLGNGVAQDVRRGRSLGAGTFVIHDIGG